MPGIRKSTLARHALATLNQIHAMAEENRKLLGNRDANETLRHATQSASNAIKTIRAHDVHMLPTWLLSNWSYYKSIGWHNDFTIPY